MGAQMHMAYETRKTPKFGGSNNILRRLRICLMTRKTPKFGGSNNDKSLLSLANCTIKIPKFDGLTIMKFITRKLK